MIEFDGGKVPRVTLRTTRGDANRCDFLGRFIQCIFTFPLVGLEEGHSES